MQIKELIKQSESKTLEIKRDLSSPQGIIKTLIAFANSAGGKIIIGVSDRKREIIGVEHPLDEEERLSSIISDNIAPLLVPNIEFARIENKTLLVITVYASGRKPHYLKKAGKFEGTLIRIGSTNRLADASYIEELERRSLGRYYDEEVCQLASMEDLDLQNISEKFPDKKVNDKFLSTLKLVAKDQEILKPTNAGVVLFAKDRRKFNTSLFVQCARFRGKDKSNFIDHLEIDSLPIDAVMEIEDFIKKHALRGVIFEGFKRVDAYNVPITALREIIVNAFVHADYSMSGVNMKVAIYDDRIEVESPGLLLPDITIEEISDGGISRLRNPNIARVFNELGLVESWGSGYLRIKNELSQLNLPDVHVEELSGRVRATIFVDISKPPLIKNQTPDNNIGSRQNQISQKTSRIPKNVAKSLPYLIEHFENTDFIKPYTVAKWLKRDIRTAQRIIKQLVEFDLLIPKGATRDKRYLASEKMKEYLQ